MRRHSLLRGEAGRTHRTLSTAGQIEAENLRRDMAMTIAEQRLLEIDLSEEPTCQRPDAWAIDVRCDVNGDLEILKPRLENRGLTSQQELWKKATAHKLSVAAKLRELSRSDLASPLEECHTVETCSVCTGCRRVTLFLNRCERHYCPECQPRLARERRESVEWWTKQIGEPKHVVLTIRNTDKLTKKHVQKFKQNFSRLRRRKFAANWRGGFYRMEVTNEKKGWHLHLHALVDCGWIDQRKLAEAWASIVKQELAIVHVRDVHSRDYLAEVTKYTVKGSQLSGWDAEQIAEFIDAFDGVRSFGVFGSLYGKRTEWRDWLDKLQTKGHTCECGCGTFRILSPAELAWDNLQRESRLRDSRALPPPSEPDLPNLPAVEGRPPMAQNW